MQNTTNYGLKKPESTDYINVNDFNENADIIDAQLKENADSITTHKNEDATLTQKGHVQLTNDLGESETLAVTQKALNNVSNEVTNVKNKVTTFENEKNLSKIKTNKDSEGIYTTVTYKRKKDNTIYCVSTLSGGETPLYTTRTEQYYDATGTSVIDTQTYSLSYDDDGNLISEV